MHQNNIEFASNAKKSELINLYNKEVKHNKASENEESPQAFETRNRGQGRNLSKSRKKRGPEESFERPSSEASFTTNSENEQPKSRKGRLRVSKNSGVDREQKEHSNPSVIHSPYQHEESDQSFSKGNSFQTLSLSPEAEKRQSVKSTHKSKKRPREKDLAASDLRESKRRTRSPPSATDTSPKVGLNKKGRLFEENESDSEDDLFSRSIISQVRSPRVSSIKKKAYSNESSPVRTTQNPEAFVQSSLVGGDTLNKNESSGQEGSGIGSSSPNPKKEKGTDASPSLKEEEQDFDLQRHKILSERGENIVDDFASDEMAKVLGVKVEGLPPKNFHLTSDSFTSSSIVPKKTEEIQLQASRLDDTSEREPRNQGVYNAIEEESVHEKIGTSEEHDGEELETEKETYDSSKEEEEESEDLGEELELKKEDEQKEAEKKDETYDKNDSKTDAENEGVGAALQNEREPVFNRHVMPRQVMRRPILSVLGFIILWLLLLVAGLSAYWYREQTYLVGYCGRELYRPTFPPSDNWPSWIIDFGNYIDENFRPKCVNCPQHARCFPNLEIKCFEDFVEYKPWYFDYLPIINPELKKCVPDTKKAEKIEIMIDVTLDLLRQKNANYNCGKMPIENFVAGLYVEELRDLLYLMKAPYISNDEFEELWVRCLAEIRKEPEIIVRQVIFFFFMFVLKIIY